MSETAWNEERREPRPRFSKTPEPMLISSSGWLGGAASTTMDFSKHGGRGNAPRCKPDGSARAWRPKGRARSEIGSRLGRGRRLAQKRGAIVGASGLDQLVANRIAHELRGG